MKKKNTINDLFEHKEVMESMDTQEDKATVDKQLEKKVEPVEVPEQDLMAMLKAVREQGIEIKVGFQYTIKLIIMFMSVILHLVGEGIVRVIELAKEGKVERIYVLGNEEIQKELADQLVRESPEEIIVKLNQYGRVAENCDDNTVLKIDTLFQKLGWVDYYNDYRKKWRPAIQKGNREDIERARQGERSFDYLFPIINEKGQLLLTEDSLGNQILADVKRCNKNGTYSFEIFRKGANGQVGIATTVSVADVINSGVKIKNMVESAEGRFSSQAASQAGQRLWLWNLSKQFSKFNEDPDDYSPNAIFIFLKDWINENVGRPFPIKGDPEGKEKELVFAEKIKDKYMVGIWALALEAVIDSFETTTKPREWLGVASREGWIKLFAAKCEGDKTTYRRAYNPSDFQRKNYHRECKSERIYIFTFTDEEAKAICDKRNMLVEARRVQEAIDQKEGEGEG